MKQRGTENAPKPPKPPEPLKASNIPTTSTNMKRSSSVNSSGTHGAVGASSAESFKAITVDFPLRVIRISEGWNPLDSVESPTSPFSAQTRSAQNFPMYRFTNFPVRICNCFHWIKRKATVFSASTKISTANPLFSSGNMFKFDIEFISAFC